MLTVYVLQVPVHSKPFVLSHHCNKKCTVCPLLFTIKIPLHFPLVTLPVSISSSPTVSLLCSLHLQGTAIALFLRVTLIPHLKKPSFKQRQKKINPRQPFYTHFYPDRSGLVTPSGNSVDGI